MLSLFFFFFQAEDGIRDTSVTGVQTCALPICCNGGSGAFNAAACCARASAGVRTRWARGGRRQNSERIFTRRSEERRVGKECRSRGAAEAEEKKKARTR